MPEPQLKEDYKNSPLLRRGTLHDYKRNQVQVPDQDDKNKAQTQAAFIKDGIENVALQSDYISRVDLRGHPSVVQVPREFQNSMNAHSK